MKQLILIGILLGTMMPSLRAEAPPPPRPSEAQEEVQEPPRLSNGERIEIPDVGFSIVPPNGWMVHKNSHGSSLLFEAPKVPNQTYQPTIQVMVFSKHRYIDEVTMKEYGDLIVEKFGKISNRVTGYRLRDAAFQRLETGDPSILYYTEFQYDDVPIMQMHILISSASNHFVMTYTDMAKVFEDESSPGLAIAYTSMHSAQLATRPPWRWRGFAIAGIAVILVLIAWFTMRFLRARRLARMGQRIEEEDHKEISGDEESHYYSRHSPATQAESSVGDDEWGSSNSQAKSARKASDKVSQVHSSHFDDDDEPEVSEVVPISTLEKSLHPARKRRQEQSARPPVSGQQPISNQQDMQQQLMQQQLMQQQAMQQQAMQQQAMQQQAMQQQAMQQQAMQQQAMQQQAMQQQAMQQQPAAPNPGTAAQPMSPQGLTPDMAAAYPPAVPMGQPVMGQAQGMPHPAMNSSTMPAQGMPQAPHQPPMNPQAPVQQQFTDPQTAAHQSPMHPQTAGQQQQAYPGAPGFQQAAAQPQVFAAQQAMNPQQPDYQQAMPPHQQQMASQPPMYQQPGQPQAYQQPVSSHDMNPQAQPQHPAAPMPPVQTQPMQPQMAQQPAYPQQPMAAQQSYPQPPMDPLTGSQHPAAPQQAAYQQPGSPHSGQQALQPQNAAEPQARAPQHSMPPQGMQQPIAEPGFTGAPAMPVQAQQPMPSQSRPQMAPEAPAAFSHQPEPFSSAPQFADNQATVASFAPNLPPQSQPPVSEQPAYVHQAKTSAPAQAFAAQAAPAPVAQAFAPPAQPAAPVLPPMEVAEDPMMEQPITASRQALSQTGKRQLQSQHEDEEFEMSEEARLSEILPKAGVEKAKPKRKGLFWRKKADEEEDQEDGGDWKVPASKKGKSDDDELDSDDQWAVSNDAGDQMTEKDDDETPESDVWAPEATKKSEPTRNSLLNETEGPQRLVRRPPQGPVTKERNAAVTDDAWNLNEQAASDHDEEDEEEVG